MRANYILAFRLTFLLGAAFVAIIGVQLRAADAPAQVTACVKLDSGDIRIVRPTDLCRKGESRLVWNVEGPQGPQGVPGVAGPQGPQGETGATGLPGEPGAIGLEGPAGPTGPQGEQGAPAATGDLGRIAYSEGAKQIRGDQGDRDVVILTLTPGGNIGENTFIKLDASINAGVNSDDRPLIAWITRDGHESTSMRMPLALHSFGGGHGGSVTWAVQATAGVTETFRLRFAHPIANPACVEFNSCGFYDVVGAMSAITAPFGASGGKPLQ